MTMGEKHKTKLETEDEKALPLSEDFASHGKAGSRRKLGHPAHHSETQLG